jgi:kumamolisin
MVSRGRTSTRTSRVRTIARKTAKKTAKKAAKKAAKKTASKAAAAKSGRVKAPPGARAVTVPGSKRPVPEGARLFGELDPRTKVEITVTLRGPKLPRAEELMGRTLAPAKFRARYSASRSDVDKVSQVLRKHGLRIDGISRETRSMRVSGTVAEMEKLFQPGLAVYTSAEQGKFRDRQRNYKVPSSLSKIVTGLIGFGQRQVATRKRARIGAGLDPLDPAALERLYQFPPGDGGGQKIAIAELGGGYFARDLQMFCRKIKRAEPRVKTISVNTPVRSMAEIRRMPKDKQKDEIDNTGEVMMDVQIVAGFCPAAEISVYFATFDQKGWVDLLDQVIRDKPVALSVSWGSAEDSSDWSPAARDAINERLQMAASLGITICVASGDDGTGDEETDRRAHLDFPSASPFALAVGGTMLLHEAGKVTEQVWWESPGKRVGKRGGSTGGGVSAIFPRPKWQDVRIASLNRKKFDGRVVPDVTALAGPPGYDMIFKGKTDYGGGTSASAPLWAALIARVNALLPPDKRQRYLTPLLYQKNQLGLPVGGVACQDIVEGHNTSSPPGFGYKAAKGFDAVSGWGTPIGMALLLALS